MAGKVEASNQCGGLDEKAHPGRGKLSGRQSSHANYFVTQFLTGHDCFKVYVRGMGKSEGEGCPYCGKRDTRQHIVLECTKWTDERG